MHFENFQRAGIPLEAQTLNASTALLKHIFQKRENHFFFFVLSTALLNQNEALKFDAK